MPLLFQVEWEGCQHMANRSGTWKKNLSGEAAYASFVPSPLPPNPQLELDAETVELLIAANKCMALLEGLSSRIPNVNLFISMYVRKEALMSSQIEGTQATLEDILDPLVDENANRNVVDVVNYVKTTEFAIRRLKNLPLCNRLIREAHTVLLEGVRGQEKTPGEFRRSQNWIGGQGSVLKNARYIPPSPDDMIQAMSDLEIYINRDVFSGDTDALIRTSLIHYQFETIHPFLDGNGRIGRLLVTLFLLDKGLLTQPSLYISYFLKRNRLEYYDRLMKVRIDGDYEQWVRFFLKAIKESAEDAISAIDKLVALHEKNFTLIDDMWRSRKTAVKLFRYIEENPIIDIQKTSAALSLSFNTTANAIIRLCEANILTQTENVRRNRTFSYEAYLEILRDGT
jgi:Fic family protein